MVDENSFLAYDDTLSRISGDDQADLDDYLDPHQGLEDDLYLTNNESSTTSGDEDEEDDQFDNNPGGMDESISLLPRHLIVRELLR